MIAVRCTAATLIAVAGSAFAEGQDRPANTLEEKAAILAGRALADTPPILGDNLGGKDDGLEDISVIYGNDDRIEPYEVTDPALAAAAEAVCILAFPSTVSYNAVDDTYSLSWSPWTSQGGTLCPDEPFRGQADFGYCSGFLVGTDLVATAGHCVSPSEAASVVFVFGFEVDEATGQAPSVVPASAVYFGESMVSYSQSGFDDHSVVRVRRAVTWADPVPLQRDREVTGGEPLVMIGHPSGLPKKVAGGATVRNPQTGTSEFRANLDAYGGNSGSAVFNSDTMQVEGILVNGATDFIFDSARNCVRSNEIADTASNWEGVSKVSQFADSVPLLGFAATPAGGTTMTGEVGGPYTPSVLQIAMSNPGDENAEWSISTADAPFLRVLGNPAGLLKPEDASLVSIAMTPEARVSTDTDMGGSIAITDAVTGRTTTIPVRIDVTGNGDPVVADRTAIPNAPISSNTTITATLDVTDTDSITDLDVTVDILHTWIGDLIVTLTSPAGTSVTLHNRSGSSADDIQIRYDDEGSVPVGSLADFDGENPAGTWTMTVEDAAAGDVGTLRSFTLHIESEAPLTDPPTPPLNEADLARTNGEYGQLDFADINAFVSGFQSGSPEADLARTDGLWGTYDFNDIARFVSLFLTGG